MAASGSSWKGAQLDPTVVGALHHRAQRRWPELQLPLGAFGEYLAERSAAFTADADCPHADDLYLACCCLHGISVAIRVLENDYLDRLLPPSVRETNRDDLRQAVLERLLSAQAPRQARLADYAGRASLRNWLRVVARRVQLNMMRKSPSESVRDAEELLERFVVPLGRDPELDCVRQRYAREFKEAFRQALRALDPRSTLVLKMHTVQGARGRDIAAVFGVRRATVVRWMAEIRRELFRTTQAHVRQSLRLSSAEFRSIVRLLRSEMDTNLSGLRETDD
ncbi:MAG: sigma-70 family RNA polymerase sigma factor [Polyangiaceae bacterium]|nr:sigma-70 family RNA polymerase sigma factor [Polyangiaceae bacterium]